MENNTISRSFAKVCLFSCASFALFGCQAADVGGSVCDAARQHVRQCSHNLLDLTQCNEAAANAILATPCEKMQQNAGTRNTQFVKDLLCSFLPEDICNFIDGFGGGFGGGGNGGEDGEVGEEPWEEPHGEEPWEEPHGEEPWEEPHGEEPGWDEPEPWEEQQPQNEDNGGWGGDEGNQGGCGGETWEGRCENNTVIWCEGGEVQTEHCGGYQCDYSPENGFFACL